MQTREAKTILPTALTIEKNKDSKSVEVFYFPSDDTIGVYEIYEISNKRSTWFKTRMAQLKIYSVNPLVHLTTFTMDYRMGSYEKMQILKIDDTYIFVTFASRIVIYTYNPKNHECLQYYFSLSTYHPDKEFAGPRRYDCFDSTYPNVPYFTYRRVNYRSDDRLVIINKTCFAISGVDQPSDNKIIHLFEFKNNCVELLKTLPSSVSCAYEKNTLPYNFVLIGALTEQSFIVQGESGSSHIIVEYDLKNDSYRTLFTMNRACDSVVRVLNSTQILCMAKEETDLTRTYCQIWQVSEKKEATAIYEAPLLRELGDAIPKDLDRVFYKKPIKNVSHLDIECLPGNIGFIFQSMDHSQLFIQLFSKDTVLIPPLLMQPGNKLHHSVIITTNGTVVYTDKHFTQLHELPLNDFIKTFKPIEEPASTARYRVISNTLSFFSSDVLRLVEEFVEQPTKNLIPS